MNGQIAQLCFWKQALNADQIKTLYDTKYPLNRNIPTPTAYWRMGSDTDRDAIDGSGDDVAGNTINDQIGDLNAIASNNMTSADISNSLISDLSDQDPTLDDFNREAPFRFMVPGPFNLRQRTETYKVTSGKK